MKFSLPAFSLRHPVAVLMTLASCVGVGIIACYAMPLKFLPEMDFPFIGSFMPYPGATPQQVEREIAIPAEGEFRTIPGVSRIWSSSTTDGCRINMRFESGTNMATASAEVRDRIERLKLKLPKDVDRILLFRHNSNSIPIMAFGLFRAGDEMEFIHLVRTIIRSRLSRVEGVAEVTIFASKPEPEVLIEFDQNRLKTHNVALYQVVGLLQTANLNMSVGSLNDAGNKFYVRVTDEYNRPEDLAEIVISPSGLRLKDVAQVSFRTREAEGHYDIDDKGGAFIIIRKESEANAVQTCRNVLEEIGRIKADPAFEGVEEKIFFDQSELILTARDGLIHEGQAGGLLAIIVLYIFLLRLRPTLVVALAIPVSMVTALGYMYFTGLTLNMITMVSMIVAVGMLVDDAIVVVENIFRYRQLGLDPVTSAIRGTQEVMVAVTASTITTVVVFIPVFYMQSGEMAAYMKQFAVPMTAALFASLFVAFTLIPLSTSRMKQEKPKNRRGEDSSAWNRWRLLRFFQVHPITRLIHLYAKILDLSLRRRLASVVAIGAVMLVTAYFPYRRVGMQDMPTLDLREIDVRVDLDQNFDMAMATDVFEQLKDAIKKQRDELDIKNLFTRYGPGGGSIDVYLKKPEEYPVGQKPPYSTQDALNILWQRLPAKLPGVDIQLAMPETRREGETAKTVSVRLSGDDSLRLAQLAEQFQWLMRSLPNITDVNIGVPRTKQEVQLQVDGPRADSAGINPSVIARTVDVALRGNRLPYLKQGGREFPVWAQFREEDRKSKDNLENVAVIGKTGLVPLNQLVSFGKAEIPASIERIDGRNVIGISGKVSVNDLMQVQRELRRLMASIELPTGYTIDVGDEFRELNANLANFGTTLSMAVILIYIVMAALFESLLLPLSILMSVPLAFIGVYWGLYITGTSLDTIGLIGCILMVGVVVRNGIVIVDHINLLRSQGMTRHEAVVQAGRDRFRPVMMTALTTILGIMPLAFESRSGGTVSFISLGRSLVAGLTTGTILTLVIVPLFYTLIEDVKDFIVHFFGAFHRLRPAPMPVPSKSPD
ncbi:MAG TPA: efflux RND transporter permease subunit [Candidatus Hydrogenedentes bacterium]|nr:efflux RND transporter permease subunit [Candidatus Hydrogenedentota bacterium]